LAFGGRVSDDSDMHSTPHTMVYSDTDVTPICTRCGCHVYDPVHDLHRGEKRSVCRAGCKTQDHESYAECLKAAAIQIGKLR
jgi:hypothetical protein